MVPSSSKTMLLLESTVVMDKASKNVSLQLFVTENPSFNNAQATSDREFAVQLG